MPSARQRCRHPGAISEIVDLAPSQSPSVSLSAAAAAAALSPCRDSFRSCPQRLERLVARPNKVSRDNINATFAMNKANNHLQPSSEVCVSICVVKVQISSSTRPGITS